LGAGLLCGTGEGQKRAVYGVGCEGDANYTYFYDADGMRTEKASGSTGTMYWRGPGGEVLTETSLTGTIDEEYIYFGGERIARVDRPRSTKPDPPLRGAPSDTRMLRN
jgi:hypothetical protein